ncbi:trehalase domain protein [Burkholderia thailandensis]|uniref:Trehalase domain protein n=1 Tax=Burkholderia thailandensis TaxID=57975 RepID=A0AAW9CSL2_BURTH|nr:trehalase domain protein [Burkholderia thailandensis]MDW9250794.1 trehalase domain protein [Burkholderia thailandensis]
MKRAMPRRDHISSSPFRDERQYGLLVARARRVAALLCCMPRRADSHEIQRSGKRFFAHNAQIAVRRARRGPVSPRSNPDRPPHAKRRRAAAARRCARKHAATIDAIMASLHASLPCRPPSTLSSHR